MSIEQHKISDAESPCCKYWEYYSQIQPGNQTQINTNAN